MIKITLANGKISIWNEEQYTDYKYDGKCFIIIRNGEWVGIYNIDYVISIVIKEKSDVATGITEK